MISVLEAINPDDASYSLDRIQERLATLNGNISFFSNGCGGSEMPVCFKYDASAVHDYIVTNKTSNLSIEHLSTNSFGIFPNPADESGFNIRLYSALNGTTEIQCINAIGQVVSTQIIDAANQSGIININSNNLEKGIYFVTVINGNQKATQKVVIK